MAREKENNNKDVAPTQPVGANVIEQPIVSEMRQSYIDYAMTVITGRALPDVRDGLKPVHRRTIGHASSRRSGTRCD